MRRPHEKVLLFSCCCLLLWQIEDLRHQIARRGVASLDKPNHLLHDLAESSEMKGSASNSLNLSFRTSAVAQKVSSAVPAALNEVFSDTGNGTELSLEEIAFTVISHYPERVYKQRSTWLHGALEALVLRKQGRVSTGDFVRAVLRAREMYPAKLWYFICDDDTYVYVDSLRAYLQGMPHTEPIAIGKKDGGSMRSARCRGARSENGIKNSYLKTGWLNGGAGIAISRTLAYRITEDDLHFYESGWADTGSDVAFGCVIQVRPMCWNSIEGNLQKRA
ncbi:hypothetical protein CYMTET_8337 [Cymbomonas tetramitiformis]|uniref:N-acetylgalactosaminide beta-1,3-galactosyltransferase n=1 Tax=Cymbomonas tetramitiformis TaxID=36881 RepID=A0AAE0GTD8_9CHLO|nr:hypothetical protein CYMTET_8337 [Cymbomonas tetramitiformis]